MAIWTYGIWHIVFVHAWEFCVKAWEFGDHRWIAKPTFYFNTVSHLNTARPFCATSKNWRHFFFLAQDLILFLSYFKSSILSLKCVKIVIEHNYLEIRVTWFLIGIYWPSMWQMSVSGLSDIFRCRCHRKILDLKVKCSYNGCPWTGELRAVQVIYLRHIHCKGVLHHFICS